LFQDCFCYTAIKNIPELSDLWNVKSSAAGSRTIKVFDKEEAYTMVRLGLPVAVMNSITAIGVVVLQGAVDVLGALYVAAYTVGCKIIGLADNATVVISFALTTYVGQNIGADNLKRTRQGVKSALVISIIFTTCITAVLIMFGKPFSAVFLKKGQKTVIDAAYSYLVICGLMLWSLGFLFVFRAALQGMGNTFVPMLSGIIELAARIGIVCLLPVKMGFSRIGIAETSAWLCAMFFLGTGYFREIKQKKKVMNSL
jgi:Na+-driven multidrug efflux pump